MNHDRFNNAFMMQASTSPFYPIFASLDVNAQMHADGSGERLWAEAVRVGIEARKLILANCKLIRPFVPERVNGKLWQDAPTEEIASDRAYFAFEPGERWHGFDGYTKDQYFVDPNKLLLTTAGIDVGTEEYADFGVPATILANYLRENGIIPEKCDLNSILFLMTPAESIPKIQNLVAALVRFEELIEQDAPLEHVLPSIHSAHRERYGDYSIRQLAQEMHDFYKDRDIKQLQKVMFREAHFPHVELAPNLANDEFTRGNIELVPIREIVGRTAAEGALPYPPGILFVVPGEVWGDEQRDYFLALEEGVNLLPGFATELQGVHLLTEPDGQIRAYGYVLSEPPVQG